MDRAVRRSEWGLPNPSRYHSKRHISCTPIPFQAARPLPDVDLHKPGPSGQPAPCQRITRPAMAPREPPNAGPSSMRARVYLASALASVSPCTHCSAPLAGPLRVELRSGPLERNRNRTPRIGTVRRGSWNRIGVASARLASRNRDLPVLPDRTTGTESPSVVSARISPQGKRARSPR